MESKPKLQYFVTVFFSLRCYSFVLLNFHTLFKKLLVLTIQEFPFLDNRSLLVGIVDYRRINTSINSVH